ncbi:ricin-type beta-trefoil lectin domain protein [Actinoplanes sp. NPDC051470]|uniref:RICIN domain-containing protein n=1 Tax=unclassified Actinoplanes TaxID=2626549 RepID=UPI00343609A3
MIGTGFWRSRRRARRSDEGSMPAAMIITLVGMTLSAAIAPLVANQIVSTRTITTRTDALQAAQAGIDVALGQLRAAGTAGSGDLEALPACTLTGASETGSKYKVTILYYKLSAAGAPAPQDCPPTDVPVTAKLTATGGPDGVTLAQGTLGTRTLESTYTFKTSNENISGGAVQLASPAAPLALCMDSGEDSYPAAGSTAKAQLCKSGGASDQRFAYTADLNLKVVSSETAGAPDGMCLEAAYPRAIGNVVKFQPCLKLTARQQWSLNDSSEFSGTRENEVVLNEFCLSLLNPGITGSDIVLGSCAAVSNKNVWRSQPGVGAGMSSAATNQLVNFKQFSRCLDVTNFTPGWPYMIVWFCKQAPNGVPPWNQAWYMSPAGSNILQKRIRTINTNDGQGYCLTTPGSTAAATYVTLTACAATGILDDKMVWTVYGDTGVYASSYRIVDKNGFCLTPTDLTATPADTHTDGTAKVKLAECTNSELQKWNAPADFNKPTVLTNTQEK